MLVAAPETIVSADIRALLSRHFGLMRAHSPISSCHVMEPEELLEAGAELMAVRQGDMLLGVGALREIDPKHGELKSMHTAAEARGQGVGQIVLDALMTRAGEKGFTRVSLETGTIDLFAAARALYRRNGFVECPPFGSYVVDPLSVFMTRTL